MGTKKQKITSMILMFVIALSFCFTLNINTASAKSPVASYLKYFKKGDYKTAETYVKKIGNSDKDTSLKPMSVKMKKAYKKVVKKYAKDINNISEDYLWGYYLADLNRDKKPELLIHYGLSEADVKTYVYTFKNGKAKKVEDFPAGHMAYTSYPGKGVLAVWGHMGYCSVGTITMKGNKLKFKDYGEQDTTKDNSEYCLPENFLYGHIKYDDDMNRSVDYSDLK